MMILTIFVMLGIICFYLIGLLIEKDKELDEALETISNLRRDCKSYYEEGYCAAILNQKSIYKGYESDEDEGTS